MDTIGNNYWHKTLLGNELWGEVDGIKHCELVLEKEVIFHEFDFETSSLELDVSKSSIWKHTTSCDKGVFSFNIISRTLSLT